MHLIEVLDERYKYSSVVALVREGGDHEFY